MSKQKKKGARTVYSGFEYDCENAILGRLLVQNPMRKCRAEAEAERVGHGCRRVNKRNAIARIVERHGEKMRSDVHGRANEHEPRTLELKMIMTPS
jgi:hypothetical protein